MKNNSTKPTNPVSTIILFTSINLMDNNRYKEYLESHEINYNLGKFRKAFLTVKRTNLTQVEKEIVQEILNYNINGKGYTSAKEILAFVIGCNTGSVNNLLTRSGTLIKSGLIKKNKQVHRPNKKGSFNPGGLWVDLEVLVSLNQQFEESWDSEKGKPGKAGAITPDFKIDEPNVIENNAPGEVYEFRSKDINARLTILRYVDEENITLKLINDFNQYWVKNGKGLLNLEHLVEYLIKSLDKEIEPQQREVIEKILAGITNDNNNIK